MSELVQIYRAFSITDFECCKALLEEHRIRVLVQPVRNSIFSANRILPFCDYALFVFEEDVFFARVLVDEYEKEMTEHPFIEDQAADEEDEIVEEEKESAITNWAVKLGLICCYLILALFFTTMLWRIVPLIIDALRQ